MKKKIELKLTDAAKVANKIKKIIFNKRVFDFNIVLGGSIVTKAFGFPIERQPNDVDLRVFSSSMKTLRRIKEILLSRNEKGFHSKEIQPYEYIVTLSIDGIDVDVLLTDIEPAIISDIRCDGCDLMKPIDIYVDKVNITDPKVALKTIGDCNKLIILLSKIIEDATDSAKLK